LAERALTAARQAEDELRQGQDRGPLHGIPVAIKDLLNLAGTPTTAGSTIRAGQLVGEDSAAVERLEAAGAIIIGKTRMSEFAYAPSSINPHYGPTRNPRAPERDTGGSSSGSAAAVADGIVFAALGSDTGGSIRIPASHCGLAGLKPTFGRISLYGAVNLAWSLDHLGPLTRTVADAALVTDALAGPDPRDARTRPAAPLAVSELLSQEPTVRGLRIGVLRDDGSGAALAPAEVLAAWQTGLRALAQAGAELVEVDLPELRTMWAVGSALLAQEALSYHLPALRSRLNEFGEFMRLRIVAAFAYPPGALVRAQQLRARLRQQANRLFDQVDLLSTPTMPAGAPLLGALSPTFFTMPFNLLGWPALSVPCGQTQDGLPLGLQLIGRPWDEPTVLRAGLVVEASVRA
jgi:aspartyl-tRNA(Asn)/glutamyl-tRNA(Gln) amidotransferase subunit A